MYKYNFMTIYPVDQLFFFLNSNKSYRESLKGRAVTAFYAGRDRGWDSDMSFSADFRKKAVTAMRI